MMTTYEGPSVYFEGTDCVGDWELHSQTIVTV